MACEVTITNMQKVIKNWVDGSKRDMKVAKLLYQGKTYPQCLFWCHLIIEKLMKALVVQKIGKHAPYIHDLKRLSELSGIEFTEEQRAWLVEFNHFNQAGRYDDTMMAFMKKCTAVYAKKYFNITQSFSQWLLQKIKLKE